MNIRSVLVGALSIVVLCSCTVSYVVGEAHDDQSTHWTFTYLKAEEGRSGALRAYIEKNWFAMDQVAVERGLFKSFRLIENVSATRPGNGSDWDFVVAVEYFDDQSYRDIQPQFEEIRSAHETVLIDGRGLSDLGAVVRSERVVFHDSVGD